MVSRCSCPKKSRGSTRSTRVLSVRALLAQRALEMAAPTRLSRTVLQIAAGRFASPASADSLARRRTRMVAGSACLDSTLILKGRHHALNASQVESGPSLTQMSLLHHQWREPSKSATLKQSHVKSACLARTRTSQPRLPVSLLKLAALRLSRV